MDKWSELRTAYMLAKLKTLSATAQEMGVHRSTVMRHIDALESALDVTLFQRNDKGYIATAAGKEVMRLGEVTDNQFSQLKTQLQAHENEITGTLKITCVSAIAAMLVPVIKKYQDLYPNVCVEILGDLRNYNLEYGEADIAFRGGDKPQTLDNVVKPLKNIPIFLCAHKRYINQFGMPNKNNITEHKFIAFNVRPPQLKWNEWIYENIPEENIVLKGTDSHILQQALFSGCGLSYAPIDVINNNSDIVKVFPDQPWPIELWTLVHRDMIKMAKIKSFLDLLVPENMGSFEW